MLILENIKFSYANDAILNDISGIIGPNQKVGLIGVNGAGKSTLLKVIIGEYTADSGTIRKPSSIGYISQELKAETENLDKDTIEGYTNKNGKHFEKYQISTLLARIGLSDKTPESKFSLLSGGQKTKVAIVKILLEEPELLVLDEPTNFLDINSANWLMKYLCTYKGAILVVSHDLRLMNQKLDKIWFLNEITHKLEQYKGNYDHFLEIKALQDEMLVKKIKSEKEHYYRLLQKANQYDKKHKTKHKAAVTREKAEEFKKHISKRVTSKHIRFKLDINKTPSRNILSVQNVSKSFKKESGGRKQVLMNISFQIERKDRMVIIGVNGAGKSTLLKILARKMKAESGTDGRARITYGDNVEIGYYAQEYENLNPDSTPMKEFEDPEIGKVRKFLGNFLFIGDKVNQDISTLSGGEKTRLALAKLFYKGSNMLLLDEPTTFLDPQSKELLGNVLADFKGTFVLVSHDPDLVELVNPTHVLLLPEEKFTYYSSNYLDRVTKA